MRVGRLCVAGDKNNETGTNSGGLPLRQSGGAQPYKAPRRKLGYALALLAGIYVGGAQAAQAPLNVYGDVGYFYTLSEADGGAQTENTYLIGSLNASAYLWKPWFATFDGGGTISTSSNRTNVVETNTEVLSSRLNLEFLPLSRFPLRLSYTSSDNSVNRLNRDETIADFGQSFRTRDFFAKQSIIGRSGKRLDGWYNWKIRGSDNFGEMEDTNYGLKYDSRSRTQNFYASAIRQVQARSLVDNVSTNTRLDLTHNYFPSDEFYIKSLLNQTRVDNEMSVGNGSFFQQSTTDITQAISFFYWRPVYKPYTMTGGARVLRRAVDLTTAQTDQRSFNANIAANYFINRKTRLTATANVATLESEVNNSLGSKQTLSALYQSDRHLWRGLNYYWYGSAELGNDIQARYETTETRQTGSATLGHSISRQWITGNRSVFRVNAQQSLNQLVEVGGRNDKPLTLVDTATLAWSENRRRGSSYAQLTLMDSRRLTEAGESQFVNFQLSRTMPLSRVSSWGGNVSVQSTRRDLGDGSDISFVTTSTAQLNYQHARLFGIYRLKLRTKLDLLSIANRGGANRKQADWQARFSYMIGKLSTALFLRVVESDSGLGSRMAVFQLSRGF